VHGGLARVKIISPSFEFLDPGDNEGGIALLKKIEHFARISHRSEDAQTEDSWKRFIHAVVLTKGDWSVTEHASASVIIRTDRGITHEIVRHRHFSFTQESTRFVNYGKREIEFVEPTWNMESVKIGHPRYDWEHTMFTSEQTYLDLLKNGQPPQAARSVLPTCTAATIAMSGNLRAWRWFFLMRTTKETHPDMKKISIPMLKEFKERIPILYDDIEPDQKQSISLSRPS